MRKFERFLFFYSIIAVIALFISFGIFEPKPLNFINLIFLSPIVFYFLIRLTGPQVTTPEVWSGRLLVTIGLLSALGIYGYFLSKQFTDAKPVVDKQLTEVQQQNEDLRAKIETLNTQISDMKSETPPLGNDESITDIIYGTPLPEGTTSGTLQRIKAKNGIEQVDVYKEPVSTSIKVGTADAGIIYPYLEKQGIWYKIVYSPGVSGWVSANQVMEVQ